MEENGLILSTFGTVINQNRDLMHIKYILALCQNVAFTSVCPLFHKMISELWIVFMLDTILNHHSGYMPIKYTLALCQNRVLMPILS